MAMLSETDLVMEEILTAREFEFVSCGDTSQPRDLLTLISCVIHNGDEQTVLNGLALLGNLVNLDWYNFEKYVTMCITAKNKQWHCMAAC